MKIIITGASGFIGKKLYKKLKSLNYEILRVSRHKNNNYYYSNDYLSLPDGDILIHLGESSDRVWVNQQDKILYEQNKNVIKHINEKKYSKVIYGSSSALYGDKSNELRNEKEKISSYDNYTKIKLFSEQNLNHSNNIILRLANVYGIGMSKQNVISDILAQLAKGNSIKLKTLVPIRDFINIDDVVNAFVFSIESNQSGIFNVGSGNPISIHGLAKKILKISNQTHVTIESLIEDKSSISNISLDITHIYNIMSWKPRVDLDTGLSKILFNEIQV
jgi:UDP-glucose 4-epimerase